MYIKRKLEEKILKYLDKPEIIAIVGPRQCGKTTLLQEIAKNCDSISNISFEDQTILRMFEHNIDDFIKIYVAGRKYLFIDEFQYARSGGKKLKYIYDTCKIKVIISGSSNVDLAVHALKFLVGRIFIFNLYPLDFEEFVSYKAPDYFQYLLSVSGNFNQLKKIKIGEEVNRILNELYEEYLIYGGYPRVVTADSIDEKKEVLKNIYNTYFLREVRDILGLIDDYRLDRLIKVLALQVGNLLEYRELSLVSEYGYISLKKYLNFLQKTFICSFVKPFFKNKRTEIVKNPKVYFCDTGLRNQIVNDFRDLDQRPDADGLLENGVFQQLVKRGVAVNFWRDKKQHEVDFILELEAGKHLAVEVKKLARSRSSVSLEIFKREYPKIEELIACLDGREEVNLKTWPVYGI